MDKLATFTIAVVIFSSVQAANLNGTYTAAEKIALAQLKDAIKDIAYMDYQKENAYLINWLTDTKLDVEKAKDKLAKSFLWRQANNIDGILGEKDMIALEKQFPFSLDGIDKTGRPIFSYRIRDLDIRKTLITGRIDGSKIKRYQLYQYEKAAAKIRENSAKLKKDVSQCIYLIDMSGFNLRSHACLACVSIFTDLVSVFTDNYPNFAFKYIYINAPRAAETVWRVFRPLTPQFILDMTDIFGFDTNEWKPYLLKYIDEDQLPPVFAGVKSVTNR